MARPPIELTNEIQSSLCDALRIGASLEHAAQYAGISSRTFSRWIKRGEGHQEEEFWQFCRSIKKARAEFVINALVKIERASSKEWTAAAWKLERMFPHIYGKKAFGIANPIDAAFAAAEEMETEDGDDDFIAT
jgi:hypothetical protein